MKKCFRFCLPNNLLRGMNQQQHKVTCSWLRYVARICDKKLDWDALNRRMFGVTMYGHNEIKVEDYLKDEQ